MSENQAGDKAVSGTGHTSGDSQEHQAVSGTGHKKKRDWKATNAKRSTSIEARRAGLSRYSFDEAIRLQQFSGDEFTERIMSGELTVAQAHKIVRERAIEALDEDRRRLVKVQIAAQKIFKYWTCMLAAARQTDIPAHRIKGWIAMILKDKMGD